MDYFMCQQLLEFADIGILFLSLSGLKNKWQDKGPRSLGCPATTLAYEKKVH
jgi:hypothetical protein